MKPYIKVIGIHMLVMGGIAAVATLVRDLIILTFEENTK